MTTLDLAALAGRPVIVGGGLAGLMTALELAPTPCVLVTGSSLGADCASDLAQGGLAAAIGPDDDPGLHAADTIAAGAGLCGPAVVERITAAGRDAVATMIGIGAHFDRRADGSLRLGLEGAHGRRRIVHADGDGTGHELTRAAVEAVREMPSITVLEHTYAVRLTTAGSAPGAPITGVWLAQNDDAAEPSLVHLATDRVVLATGGLGSLFGHTTNPRGARGSGIALGLRAGAVVRDLEMVQFHPTALDVGLDPMPLVSEAVRGEGAVLVTRDGVRLLSDPLAARDVVSRAVWGQLQTGVSVCLDARGAIGADFPRLFPTVTAACRAAGIDPVSDLVPIHPAAHYAMGGLLVDDECRTSVPGLWAVGEVSSTGLHGANRLASNSLLEAIVCAGWAAHSVRGARISTNAADAANPWTASFATSTPIETSAPIEPSMTSGTTPRTPSAQGTPLLPDPALRAPGLRAADPPTPAWAADPRAREVLTAHAGVLRDRAGLLDAISELSAGAIDNDARLVSLLMCVAALRREESRGGHWRTDHPESTSGLEPTHTLVTIADADPAVIADLVSRHATSLPLDTPRPLDTTSPVHGPERSAAAEVSALAVVRSAS